MGKNDPAEGSRENSIPEFSLTPLVGEDFDFSQTSVAIATEWLVSIIRWMVLLIFAFLRPFLSGGIPSAGEPFYAILLVGALHNLYVTYLLITGAVRSNLSRFLAFFIFSDILVLIALAYFSNIYQSGLLIFYLLLIVIIALRANLRLSLLLGPIMIFSYFFSTYYLLDPSRFRPESLVLDSIGLMALTAFCGWFSEGKSRAWQALYNLSQRFKAVNKSLGETQRRLEIYRRLEEMRREFIAMVSHELRTPLTAIFGYLDLLLLGKAGPINDGQRRFVANALTQGEGLERLIGNLLDLSLIQSGRWTLELRNLAPAELIDQACGTFSRDAAERGVILSTGNADGELPEIIADSRKIRKVLENLIGNAVKFSPKDGTVEVSAVESDDSSLRDRMPHLISNTRVVTFTVSDRGPGISPKEQNLVFESFHRIAENIGKTLPRGGGLGLAIAKEFVELHWGKIWYENTRGGGSTFCFSLPVSPLRPRQRIALVKSSFNLESLLRGLFLQFDDEINRKRLNVVRAGWLSQKEKEIPVNADRQLMQTLFFNILSNQVRYASSGSDLFFGVEERPGEREMLVISCRNSGEPMSWEVIEKLRNAHAEEEEDLAMDLRQVGVGLGVARDVIETHGGSFFVNNTDHGGVEVTIHLPRQ